MTLIGRTVKPRDRCQPQLCNDVTNRQSGKMRNANQMQIMKQHRVVDREHHTHYKRHFPSWYNLGHNVYKLPIRLKNLPSNLQLFSGELI